MSGNSQIAFNPIGNTVVVAAAGTAPTGVQAPVFEKFNPQNAGQYRFVNVGTNTVFLGTGPTAALARPLLWPRPLAHLQQPSCCCLVLSRSCASTRTPSSADWQHLPPLFTLRQAKACK